MTASATHSQRKGIDVKVLINEPKSVLATPAKIARLINTAANLVADAKVTDRTWDSLKNADAALRDLGVDTDKQGGGGVYGDRVTVTP